MNLYCVVPFYNEASYLPACIKSLAAQTDQDFSLVLVDNASTDDSKKIAHELIAKLGFKDAVIITETQKGTGSAIDTGFRYAIKKGATDIARTDADCVAAPDWIASLRAELESGTELVLGKLGYREDDIKTHLTDKFMFPFAVAVSDIYGSLTLNGKKFKSPYKVGAGNNMAITADLYERSGGFPRKPLDDQDDDVALFAAARQISSKVRRAKKVRSYASLRRTRKYGYWRTMLYYWDRKYKPSEIDVR